MMGATKVNFEDVKAVNARDIQIESFELNKSNKCKIFTHDQVRTGDTILVKASFLNACYGQDEQGNRDEENVLYRRRVVPFVTKVREIKKIGENRRKKLMLNIENISQADCNYLYKKMNLGKAKKGNLLEIEAKKITFSM